VTSNDRIDATRPKNTPQINGSARFTKAAGARKSLTYNDFQIKVRGVTNSIIAAGAVQNMGG
jgi:hypothetical protein